MTPLFKPMLAGSLKPPFILSPSRFPLLASPKLDGIRATVQGKVLSRSLKPIGNLWVSDQLSRPELYGLDGELICGDPTEPDAFRKTGSAVGASAGKPANVTFWVFDCYDDVMPYKSRLEVAQEMIDRYAPHVELTVRMLGHKLIEDPAQLIAFEESCMEAGFEGAMIRSLDGPYKQGRSTATEGYLLKLKRFLDAEGVLLEVREEMENKNPATVNALGRTERSSHVANKAGKGTLGSFVVRNLETGVVHRVSPGNLTAGEAQEIFTLREKHIGRIVKFKYFPTGSKDKPRFTQFVGWRDPSDMDEV